MIGTIETKDTYLADFARREREAAGRAPAWLTALRQEAIARFGELGFPTRHHEEWRFTNIAPLLEVPFHPAPAEPERLMLERLRAFTFPGLDCCQLVFVNGRYAPELSTFGYLPEGVQVLSLAEALEAEPEAVGAHLARYAEFEQQAFTALNTAFLEDGAFVSLPRGVIVERPIHLLYVSTAPEKPTVSYPRTLFIAGENSQATLIESYAGWDGEVYFTNAVTEIVLGENAVVDHYKVLRESLQAFHIADMRVHLERTSNFASHSITLGGALVRNEVYARLNGEGGECTLNGLYLANGRRLVDNHTAIDHAMPNCTSHEVYKGILDDRAHGVFNGKIFVRPDAQKTDAKQTNKTLLLSEDAQINTKPQLEIFADDVRCTHGATVGQLDEDALFYMRSRGIGEEQARNILTFAFASEIISRIKVEPVRAQLEQALFEQLPGGHETEELLK
ncbi:MAG TPA: Fe-S cluster assembly protein SufD [Chthonomonadaceae bacterium]|nr:Fe-S cluster assembly protein SufD [Chthonomonadaceae bacterium]